MENLFAGNDALVSDMAVYDFYCSVSSLCELECEIEIQDIEHMEMVLKPLINMFNRKKSKLMIECQSKVA